MKIMSRLEKQNNELRILVKNNAEPIFLHNTNMFKTFILVGIIAMLIPILISPFSESKSRLIPIYLGSIILFILVFLMFQIKPFKEKPVLGIYLVFTGAFLFSIYMSVVNSPEQRATIILGLFCIFPLCLIDKPLRVDLFSIGVYLVHTALAFIFKGSVLGLDDAVNCLCFLTLGIVVGNQMIKTRVEAFETKRQLILEKETDELTGLKNRRKLFQLIGEYRVDDSNAPSSVIMIEIDDT